MSAKIPPDAFEYYLGLGPGRSYGAVAEEYGVTKRAVTKLAARENWQQRIHKIERKPRPAMPQGEVPGVKPRKGECQGHRESPNQPFSAGRGKGVGFQWGLRLRAVSRRESGLGSIYRVGALRVNGVNS